MTTSSGMSQMPHNISSSSERGQELMRLKKEYHNMVRNELSKMKKDGKGHTSIEQYDGHA
jgi:hypothetical protein